MHEHREQQPAGDGLRDAELVRDTVHPSAESVSAANALVYVSDAATMSRPTLSDLRPRLRLWNQIQRSRFVSDQAGVEATPPLMT